MERLIKHESHAVEAARGNGEKSPPQRRPVSHVAMAGWLAGSKVVFLPRLPLTSSSRWDGQGIREESFTGALSATLSSSSTTTAGAAAAAASIETFECGGNEAAAAVSQSAIFAAVCAVLLCIMAGERFYGPFLFPFALATHLMVW